MSAPRLERRLMQVQVNGETQEVPDGLTVTGLLSHLRIKAERVAVERNRLVVKRATFNETTIQPGDEIEILTFVGGG
jgi:sulfur carrier protein